jgi:hypothetical protein
VEYNPIMKILGYEEESLVKKYYENRLKSMGWSVSNQVHFSEEFHMMISVMNIIWYEYYIVGDELIMERFRGERDDNVVGSVPFEMIEMIIKRCKEE